MTSLLIRALLCTWWINNIYIQNGLECTTLTELNMSPTGWEYLCVEVGERKPHSKKYTICNVYNTPSDIVEDITTFR